MGMELLALPHLGVFYPDAADLARARRERLLDLLGTLAWVATIDAFQHWLYTHPGHARDARREAWLAVHRRFGTVVSGIGRFGRAGWDGLDDEQAWHWHRQLHLFQCPFYYIEYGIAQLGALGLWAAARTDPAGTLAAYRRALALGGSVPLPELFAAAGLPFDFSEATLAPLMDRVSAELARGD